ncbi:MAG: hypothetical protein P4M08_15795 [Oligoflexia bacterium]|nr:hypothetical protein [Oligoflexia bacterium]
MNHSSEDREPIHRKVDFGIWEKMYGRTLTDDEKKEIGERMSGFFRLLIQEDLRQKKETHQKQIADLEKTANVYGVEI